VDSPITSNIGGYGIVKPSSHHEVVEGERTYYWSKSILKTLQARLSTEVLSQSMIDGSLMSFIDLVIGGDHGQGAFRMTAKGIIRQDDHSILTQSIMSIGHIDCRKDTYKILSTTIMPKINNDIRKIQSNEYHLNLYKKSNICTPTSYTVQFNNGGDIKFHCPESQLEIKELEFVKQIPIRVFVCGDLEFYATMLGKCHSSGHWCTWCNLSQKEWRQHDHNRGQPWTLSNMRHLRDNILSNEIKDTSNNRKGINNSMLLNCIEPTNYIYPILHSEIGIGNKILCSFFEWVEYRVESISYEEKELRNSSVVHYIELEELQQRYKEFTEYEGVQILHLKQEEKNYKDLYMNLKLTNEEKEQLDDLILKIKNELNQLIDKRNQMQSALKLKRQVYYISKKKVDELISARGKKGSIRLMMEDVMKKNGIKRPHYHGGDLTGKTIKVLFQKASLIFNQFRIIINEIEDKPASPDEVNDITSMYEDLFYVLDGLYSLMRTPCGKFTEELEDLMQRYIDATMKMWRFLRLSLNGPKIHGIEDHLCHQIKMFHGIGDYAEDFIEQSHQKGMKDEVRTRNLSRGKAFDSISIWEYKRNDSNVIEVKEEVNLGSARKRKRERFLDDKQDLREMKRLKSLDRIEGSAYSMIDDYKCKPVELNNVQ
jgi:hypothetical protein